MRTFTPLAALATKGELTQIRPVKAAIIVAAVGELVVDKLPSTPSRTAPAGLAGRMISAGICGLTLGRKTEALIAAATAAATTFLAHDARAAVVRKTQVPDPPVALIEDLVAASTAILAAQLIAAV